MSLMGARGDKIMRSFIILVSAENGCNMPSSNGYLAFSMLCNLVSSTPLDSVFHSDGEVEKKSFSISFLRRVPNEEISDFGRDLSFQRGEYAVFRVSFVIDEEADAFAGIIARRLRERVRLGSAVFRLERILAPGQHPLALSISLGSGIGGTEGSVAFRFVSPTGFKREGKQFFLPLPELVIGDLLRKYRRFAGEPTSPDIDMDSLASRVEITRYNIRSHASKLRNDRIIRGFCGEVAYSTQKLSPQERHLASALESLAFFTGIGYKTTQGMGEVLPLSLQ
jgi:CRISPR-associated endoribonuclease Cas6